jgi:hypothetical protein
VRRRHLPRALLLALVLLGAALAQDKTANPDYERWASFKLGSWVKLVHETTTKAGKLKTEETLTLEKLAADKVELEVEAYTLLPGGQKGLMAERSRGIPAVLRPRGDTGTTATTKESDEEVEVGDRRLRCRVIDTTYESGGKVVLRNVAWISTEVPGGVAKRLVENSETTTRSRVVDFGTK